MRTCLNALSRVCVVVFLCINSYIHTPQICCCLRVVKQISRLPILFKAFNAPKGVVWQLNACRQWAFSAAGSFCHTMAALWHPVAAAQDLMAWHMLIGIYCHRLSCHLSLRRFQLSASLLSEIVSVITATLVKKFTIEQKIHTAHSCVSEGRSNVAVSARVRQTK